MLNIQNVAIAALTAIALLTSGCGSKNDASAGTKAGVATSVTPAGPPPGLPVKAVPVKIGAVIDEVTAVGSLLAEESVVIRPEIDGRIVGLHFQEGQAVSRGRQAGHHRQRRIRGPGRRRSART